MNIKEIEHLANLASLEITSLEASETLAQLETIFSMVQKMQTVDTEGIEPLFHPIAMINELAQPLREDAVTEQNQRKANMSNAPAQHEGLFLVPKVIE
jgi:aspartyl-tRNA(Asn)/glutamyl-tRNA(Gln) amidotransferase subunit C